MPSPRTDMAVRLAQDIELSMRRYPDPAVRGAALAQALAWWLGDHAEDEREDRLKEHVGHVLAMLRKIKQMEEEKGYV